MTDRGKEARNSTTQTQRKTISLNMNSPARFQAIGSVDKLHLTTPGVVKKNDQVMAKVTTPISEPAADKIGLNAPAARSAAITNSTTPRKYASPLKPNIDSHQINGLLLMNWTMPCADCNVNFCMPNDTKITTMTQRRMASRRYDPPPLSATLQDIFMAHFSFCFEIDFNWRAEMRSLQP